MIKPTKMTPKQLEEEINKLDIREKTRLVKRLLKETWEERFRNLLARIDKRVKESPITHRELEKIVEEAREEFYSQHGKNRH